MSVSVTAILAIEDSLANRLTKTWKRIVAEMVAVAMPYVERKEWDKAYKLADRLDMSPVFDQNREFIKYCTYSSMLFGASRLRKDLKNSAVANKSWGWFIDDVLVGVRVQIRDNVGKQAREAYFAEIARLEEQAKQVQLSSVLKANFNPDQPRDANGRFASTGDSPQEREWLRDGKKMQRDYMKKGGRPGTRFDMVDAPPRSQEECDMLMKFMGGIGQFVLKQGEWMSPPSEPPNIELGEMKQCFMNAGRMALFNDDYEYVEGYMISTSIPFPIHHGWVVKKGTNEVIDPTMGWRPDARYVGVRHPQKFLMRKINENGYWGTFMNGRDLPTKFLMGEDPDFEYKK